MVSWVPEMEEERQEGEIIVFSYAEPTALLYPQSRQFLHVPPSLRDIVEADTLGMARWNRANLIVAALLNGTLFFFFFLGFLPFLGPFLGDMGVPRRGG